MSNLESPSWFNEDLQKITDRLSPRVGGLQQVRSVIDMLDPDAEFKEETDFNFGMTAIFSANSPKHLSLFGDTTCRQGRMFAVSASLARIEILNPPEELTREDVEALAYWALHPLYDFTLRNLNVQIAGSSEFSDLKFPHSPEQVNFQSIDPTKDEDPKYN